MWFDTKRWVRAVSISVVSVCILFIGVSPSHADNPVVARVAAEIEQGEHEGVTGGVLSVNGDVLFEVYAPGYNAGKRHDIRSATKSVTALLIGALIDEGKLKNTRVKLSSILQDEFANLGRSDPRHSLRIEDLLTMRGGLACNDWAPASVGHEDKMYETADWFAFWVNQPVAYERGKHFSYCTGGVVALGRVIEKLSGMPVPAYAEQKLFAPLGIEGARWEKTPTDHTDTGGHLRLRLNDLQKIGLMVAAEGVWEDEQIISKRWIKDMVEPQTRIPERRQQYGFLWWYDNGKVKDKPVSIMYAHGNGGNFIFIIPELELVASFTGKNYGKPTQFKALQLLTRELVPSLVPDLSE
ncbi:serine hydrolase domain-containing protein [Kordiimonas aquimaris]|uniref:serine hydrolase domain-containing protein n=1 Tax=Kordiimonas aquimaris TaxID=707591 RepID=UPI0021D22A1E|nr:serine hydrolase [Kordiimonas aquimaris]